MPARTTLFDVNLWVALTFSSHPQQQIAQKAFRDATRKAPACFCRTTQQSYLRLVTNETLLRAYGSPRVSNQKALGLMSTFLAQPEVMFLVEPAELEAVWHKLAILDVNKASPKIWMDAYLAAFAICADVTLSTLDRDFIKYKPHGLDVKLLTA